MVGGHVLFAQELLEAHVHAVQKALVVLAHEIDVVLDDVLGDLALQPVDERLAAVLELYIIELVLHLLVILVFDGLANVLHRLETVEVIAHPCIVQIGDALDLLASAYHVFEQLRIDVLFRYGRRLGHLDAYVVVVIELEVRHIKVLQFGRIGHGHPPPYSASRNASIRKATIASSLRMVIQKP